MANRPIILTDTTDRILPLAWGVAGGDVNANKVTVANTMINSNIANIKANTINLNGADIDIYGTNRLNMQSPNVILQGDTANIAAVNLIMDSVNFTFT